jgi:cell division protein FtsB
MRRLIPIAVLILIIVLGIIYLPGISKYLKLKEKETQLDRDIAHLEQEIKLLKEEEHLLKTDPSHLEDVVREELGLVKPGEIVYKVIEEEVPAKPR